MQDLAHQLLKSIRQFQKFNHINHSIHGLKKSEIMMLMVIRKDNKDQNKAITISEISAALKITSPSVTQVINRLERDEYVQRRNDEMDGRIVRISLTEKGAKLTKEIHQKMEATYNNLVIHLGEEKSKLFIELLDEVYHFFSKEMMKTDHNGK